MNKKREYVQEGTETKETGSVTQYREQTKDKKTTKKTNNINCFGD